MRAHAQRVIKMQPAQPLDDRFPIVPGDLGACPSADQWKLKYPCVDDVRPEVEEVSPAHQRHAVTANQSSRLADATASSGCGTNRHVHHASTASNIARPIAAAVVTRGV